MSIRQHVTLWCGGVILFSTLLVAGLSWHELHEPGESPLSRREATQEIAGIILWCGLPAVLVSLGAAWWLSRRVLAPVASLTLAVERVHDRNLRQPVPRTGNGDELDRLAKVFNDTMERLDGSIRHIREFTLHASHELKTPLTIMQAGLETTLREEQLPPAVQEKLESQFQEIQRLACIVDSLALLTKADAGQVVFKREPVRLDLLLREASEDALVLARPSGVTVHLQDCPPLMVIGDRHRLRQLLLNLTDNAIKYNEPGGRVEMSVHRDDGSVKLVIANTGPGIEADVLPRIGERFFRGDPAHGSDIEGCGLGVSIATWIAKEHGGAITINSTPEGRTTVTVRLPLARPNA